MTNKLNQKKNFKTSHFELREHGLYVTKKSLHDNIEEEISYEDISNKIVRLTIKEPFYIFLTVGFVISGIIALANGSLSGFFLLILVAVLFLIRFQASIHKIINIYLQSNKAISIEADIPDSNSVEEFVELLKTTIKNYLIKKYAPLDKDLPIEGQLNSLVWLKNNNYLNDDEFKEYKEKLLRCKNDSKIGFGS
jgi:hypothetical protein